jgi:glycosyltransferase involved in cell wall biosynthesis
MVPGRLTEELDAAGVHRLSLDRSSGRDVLAFRHLLGHLRTHDVDVLHAHKFGSNLWGTVFGRLARVPVVIAHEHTWSYEGDRRRMFLDGKVIAPLATRFVAVSELDRRRMIELEGVPAAKTVVVPTAYLPRPHDGPAGDLRGELGIPAGAPVVGTLAAMRRQKRLDLLIDAFADVLERLPEAHLVIGGDGDERAQLSDRAAQPGLRDHVHFLGAREDLATVLGGFDVAAMSSDFEGMPLFVLEAMTHGVPLLCTAVGGIPDVLEDDVTGVLVAPADRAGLADALEALLTDPERRARLAAAAQERAREFTLERIAGRFADLYEQLLAERGRR